MLCGRFNSFYRHMDIHVENNVLDMYYMYVYHVYLNTPLTTALGV